MQPDAPASRPRPILDAIRSGMWKTALGAAITAAVSFGVLDGEQATLVNNVVAAIATLVTVATSLLVQFHILAHAEPEVTPLADPQDDAGHQLVAATGGSITPPPSP